MENEAIVKLENLVNAFLWASLSSLLKIAIYHCKVICRLVGPSGSGKTTS